MRASGYENGVKAVSEQTPLLAETAETAADSSSAGANQQYDSTATNNNTSNVEDTGDDGDAADKPLPVWQVIVLCYARFVEPVAFFSIFPYINTMVRTCVFRSGVL